jgi:hypothetical protein
MSPSLADEIVRIRRRRHHVEARPLKNGNDPRAEEGLILSHDYPDRLAMVQLDRTLPVRFGDD